MIPGHNPSLFADNHKGLFLDLYFDDCLVDSIKFRLKNLLTAPAEATGSESGIRPNELFWSFERRWNKMRVKRNDHSRSEVTDESGKGFLL